LLLIFPDGAGFVHAGSLTANQAKHTNTVLKEDFAIFCRRRGYAKHPTFNSDLRREPAFNSSARRNKWRRLNPQSTTSVRQARDHGIDD
jgi:hypothetical protein